MNYLLARRSSTSSLRSQSELSITTPSDQKPREVKSAPYRNPRYATVLASKGSFMEKSDLDITDESKDLCRTLLETEQTFPRDSLFRDDLFDKTRRMMQDRNEAKVVQDITRLIVPSAETLAAYGARDLAILNESVNEGWNSAIPVYGPRPQPDYSVGFGRSTFTDDQLKKLEPFVGALWDNCTSYFMATWRMYFPFLTCEVKCGEAALDIADRQNAHSMTLAVRSIVELFRLVKREKDVHRQILAFAISHSDRSVRIYGHYAVIDGPKTTFYRHPIRTFDFTELDGKEKWTAYRFTKNVYENWIPMHLERILSAVDAIPSNITFGLSEAATSSRQLDLPSSHQSSASVAPLEKDYSQASLVGSEDLTPNTSLSQQQFKKPRNKRTAE